MPKKSNKSKLSLKSIKNPLKNLEYTVTLLYPKVILGYRKDFEDSVTVGVKVSDLNTGVTLEKYDYGYILEISLLGFGVSVWWIV